jgi:hypothetical protein
VGPNTQLPKLMDRITKLNEDAERFEKWVLVRLDLKGKHAALREFHNNTTQSTAVIGFTAITIIFTPLAFLATLLPLPVNQFQRSQTLGPYLSGYIATWMSECISTISCPFNIPLKAVGEILSLFITGITVAISLI